MNKIFLKTLLSVVGIATLGIQASCAQKNKETSDLQYALLHTQSLSFSLLKEMSERKTLKACVSLHDKTSNAEEETFIRSLSSFVQAAVREWGDLIMKNDPSWPQKQRNDVSIVPGNKCGTSKFDFDLNIWKNNESFQADITQFYKTNNWKSPETGVRSHAIPSKRTINYNHSEDGGSSAHFVIKHEFGHLLGLGDVYEEKGYQVGIGLEYHPPSVMKGNSSILTKDDALGVVSVWKFLKQGVQSCDSSSQKKVATISQEGTLFCIPKTRGQSPVITDTEGDSCPRGTTFSTRTGSCMPNVSTSDVECPRGMVLDSRSKLCVAERKSGNDSCSVKSSDAFSCMLQGAHCQFDDSKKLCVTKSGSTLDEETEQLEKSCKPGDKYDVTRNKCVKVKTAAKKVIVPEELPREEANTEMQPKKETSATQETGSQCSQHTSFSACFKAWPACKYSHASATCANAH